MKGKVLKLMLHLTAKNFEQETSKEPLVVVLFYAVWCGKCAMMKPIVEDIEKNYKGRIKFCEVDIGESPSLAAKYHADVIPAFVFFKKNTPVGRLQGMIDDGIFEKRMKRILSIW